MGHKKDLSIIPAGPNSADLELVASYFLDKCNCYSYAVQDYLAGHLTRHLDADFGYLPRPGQTRGITYLDLKGHNIEGMRRAIHEDGLNFAGATYPKRIPENHYVICCFLEPTEYHFIRQNQDGSWSSKNGREEATTKDAFGEPLTDPENFYHHDKTYPFVGYFFVPKGGIQVGVKAFEKRRLLDLQERAKTIKEKQQQEILEKCVCLSDQEKVLLSKLQKLSGGSLSNQLERSVAWNEYEQAFDRLSRSCLNRGYVRRDILKSGYTHPKQVRLNKTR